MPPALTSAQRTALLDLAEATIRAAAENDGEFSPFGALGPWAKTRRATFVTVYVGDDLNGCIGTLDARRAVAEDVAHNAHRAAFHDPRFPPVSADELDDVSVHVSVLGPLQPMKVDDQADLIDQMRANVDGIVLVAGENRGTFLPSVWAKLPEPEDFLVQLKRKAGLLPDEWPAGLKVYRFEVESFDRETA